MGGLGRVREGRQLDDGSCVDGSEAMADDDDEEVSAWCSSVVGLRIALHCIAFQKSFTRKVF